MTCKPLLAAMAPVAANGLNETGYHNSFTFTHLGQLWQGPLSNAGPYQYLYCTSSAPHQLLGLYATDSTCSSKSGKVYASTYDNWGNVTSRTTGGNTATLSYDDLDHFVEWNSPNSNPATQEWYAYDASGTRALRRSTSGSTTTITTYAFGAEEHTYTSSGTLQSNTFYYSLGGQLIGELTGTTTQTTSFFLTDGLGSVLATFSNTVNTAAVLGNQVYGPYGTGRYQSWPTGTASTMGTNKGFTGQYGDVTGLDYYHARYYDPSVGVFLSADIVQGNMQGMNPYDYVGGNPETHNDPTGQAYHPPPIGGGGNGGAINASPSTSQHRSSGGGWNLWGFVVSAVTTVSDMTLGIPSMVNDVQTIFSSNGSWLDKTLAGADLLMNVAMDVSMVVGIGEGIRAAYVGLKMGAELALHAGEDILTHEAENAIEHAGEDVADHTLEDAASHSCGGLSFASATLVATSRGEQAIGTLKVGQTVLAYNPQTKKMEYEPILHVWINHDNDLVDLTISARAAAQHGKANSSGETQTSEVIHTNKKHPFLTEEKGFLPVAQITLGMHILQADGQYGVITGWTVVPGVMVMYNLEVAQDHTYTVGVGEWVVHNCGGVPEDAKFAQKTYSRVFSEDGKFNKSPVTQVIDQLKSGVLNAADVPIEYIKRGASTLILNTRSTVSLIAAGIDRSAWVGVDKTGDALFEGLLDNQLANNGLSDAGINT